MIADLAAPPAVQLSIEEYIVALLGEHKAFILYGTTSGEAIVVIEPMHYRFEIVKELTERNNHDRSTTKSVS